jgi:hypothetical protein
MSTVRDGSISYYYYYLLFLLLLLLLLLHALPCYFCFFRFKMFTVPSGYYWYSTSFLSFLKLLPVYWYLQNSPPPRGAAAADHLCKDVAVFRKGISYLEEILH